jgi:hypothetical protein
VIKKIFERRPEEIDDQNVVQAFLAEVVDIRDTGYCESVQWPSSKSWVY